MNLYVTRRPEGLGHICAGTSVGVTNAEGETVGFVKPALADWLVQQGMALDLTDTPEQVSGNGDI